MRQDGRGLELEVGQGLGVKGPGEDVVYYGDQDQASVRGLPFGLPVGPFLEEESQPEQVGGVL